MINGVLQVPPAVVRGLGQARSKGLVRTAAETALRFIVWRVSDLGSKFGLSP